MVELHCHTTASDGVLTPTELVERASGLGITHLAITDHDTTAAWEEACLAANRAGIEMVPGVEVSCYAQSREIHVLGYFFDPDHRPLQCLMSEMRQARELRMREMLQRLSEINVVVEFEEVARWSRGSIGRPHLARALVERGLVKSFDDAFERYIGRGKPGYVARRTLSPGQATEALKAAGGVAVLAHPGLIKDMALVSDLLELGFDGLEARHPSHSSKEMKRFTRLARSRHLLATGGSDFHQPGSSTRPELGAMKIGSETVEALRQRSRQIA